MEGIELAGGVQSGVQITELEEEVESIGSVVGQFGYIIYLCVSKFALNLLTFIYIYIYATSIWDHFRGFLVVLNLFCCWTCNIENVVTFSTLL